MCLADGAAKMSSSRVIKAGRDEQQISGFSFDTVLRAGTPAAALPAENSGEFIPMALFDPSELTSKGVMAPQRHAAPDLTSEPPADPAPPSKTITDEDLQRYQEESYQRGLQDGKSLAERGLLNVFKSLRTATEGLQQARDKLLRESEEDLLQLALAIARKVIGREVREDRKIVLNLIKMALATLSSQDELLIRVHPDDYALLTTSLSGTVRHELAAINFTLKPDVTIEIGSCQIEAERGTVDAGFEAQLDEIYRRLVEERTDSVAQASGAGEQA